MIKLDSSPRFIIHHQGSQGWFNTHVSQCDCTNTNQGKTTTTRLSQQAEKHLINFNTQHV